MPATTRPRIFYFSLFLSKNIQHFIFAYCLVWVWNLVNTLREEGRPGVIENGMLGHVFGSEDKSCGCSRHDGRWRKVDIPPLIFNLGSRWASVRLYAPGALSRAYDIGILWRGGRLDRRADHDPLEGSSLAGNRTTILWLSRPQS
jgi:hypothetical protein